MNVLVSELRVGFAQLGIELKSYFVLLSRRFDVLKSLPDESVDSQSLRFFLGHIVHIVVPFV
jgi:hypothetical protein